MRGFSIGAAIGDGFGLVMRRPLSVLVWGLLLVAPIVATFVAMIPMMAEFIAAMPEDPAAPPDPRIFQHMLQFQLWSMLLNVVQLLAMVVVYTAIMRAVLRPSERSFFSLRVGMDELRVAVVGLAIGMGLYAAVLILFLLGAAVLAAVWYAGEAARVLVIMVMVFALLVAVLWAMARVSLIAPASVLHRDFAFVQGWRLAGGKGWRLFGMMLAIMAIILVVEMVFVLIGVAVVSGVAVTSDMIWDPAMTTENPFEGLSAWLSGAWSWIALACVPLAWLYGAILAVSIAPFASACRQLAEPDAAGAF